MELDPLSYFFVIPWNQIWVIIYRRYCSWTNIHLESIYQILYVTSIFKINKTGLNKSWYFFIFMDPEPFQYNFVISRHWIWSIRYEYKLSLANIHLEKIKRSMWPGYLYSTIWDKIFVASHYSYRSGAIF